MVHDFNGNSDRQSLMLFLIYQQTPADRQVPSVVAEATMALNKYNVILNGLLLKFRS